MGQVVINKQHRIVHLSYGVKSSGDYTMRLHEAFRRADVDSSVLSLHSDISGDPHVYSLSRKSRLIANIDGKIQAYLKRNTIKDFGLFSFPVLASDVSKFKQITDADAIYVHWALHGFLNLKMMEKLAQTGKPIFFVLHDMWNITGGCHHSFDCTKYRTGCFNCQIFTGQKDRDLSAIQYEKKKNFLSRYSNIFFISPSRWLLSLSKQSGLTKEKPIYHIPNPIDISLFKPFDKKTAKNILNIEEDEKVLLFGANQINSPYKGWEYLKEALATLKQSDLKQKIRVLIFGSGPNRELQKAIPFASKFMGFITDDYTLNLIYNASDVFIVPSLADNLPTTVLESLSCGTPVVGFNVGGIPEMINHKMNGYLAQYRDAQDLQEGIRYCLDHNIKGSMLPEYFPKNIMEKHTVLLDSMISNRIDG